MNDQRKERVCHGFQNWWIKRKLITLQLIFCKCGFTLASVFPYKLQTHYNCMGDLNNSHTQATIMHPSLCK